MIELLPTSDVLTFSVPGRPQQRGSKTPWIPRTKSGEPVTKNGRIVIATMDSNKKSLDWMTSVRQVAAEAMNARELLTGPIKLSVAFYFARPLSHYRKGGGLTPKAPGFHVQTPDLSKLIRCLEDACTGVVWVDDRQVYCYGEMTRIWTTETERAEVLIEHEIDRNERTP